MNNLPPELPSQQDAAADFNAMRRSNRSLQPMQTAGTLTTHSPVHGVMQRPINQPRRVLPGTNGIDLAKPRNYDHTKSYKGKRMVYVQAADPLCTVGTTDPDSGEIVKSIPGWWLSLQSVAPKDMGGGVTRYYIPHLPMPTPDDMDAVNNYWTFIAPEAQCY